MAYDDNALSCQLGMEERLIGRLNSRQLSVLFCLPLLPSLLTGCGLVWAGAEKIHWLAFTFPVFSGRFWIFQSFGAAFAFFILLYGVYYIAARISYEKI